MRRACLEKGFFQITKHGVSEELQAAIFEQSKEFFSLPLEEKVKLDKGKAITPVQNPTIPVTQSQRTDFHSSQPSQQAWL